MGLRDHFSLSVFFALLLGASNREGDNIVTGETVSVTVFDALNIIAA
jgi:hypothetical protein